MSIQLGIWNLDGRPIEPTALQQMCSSVEHFGPDGEFTHIQPPIGVMYRPLHITSENRLEQQPYVFHCGRILTWVGRLDNRDDLVSQLNDLLTTDRSDVGIVAAAFLRWGTACFHNLVGDWSLSLWNPEDQELILARDFSGIQHLFYYVGPTRIVWCNHLEPLLQSGSKAKLCERYIAGYLAFYPDADLTPYEGIKSVPPGKFVRLRSRQVSIYTYWTLNPQLRIRYKHDSEYEEHFRFLFRQAVRRRLRTDSPILAGLSGGLDSSSLVCVADDILRTEGAATPSLDTLSFCDRDEPDEEDFFYFKRVEEKRGRMGHHLDLVADGNTFSFHEGTFRPVPGFGERHELKLGRERVVRNGGYRVFLSGIGGDEFTGQALDFRVQMADLLVQLRWRCLAKDLTEWSLVTRHPLLQLLAKSTLIISPTWLRVLATKSARIDPWVQKDFAKRNHFSQRLLVASEGHCFWRPSARDAYQTVTNLQRQMTFTLPAVGETRYPFLDRDLIEFLVAVPSEQLVKPGQRRSLLRRALAELLPPDILSRRTKSSAGRCVMIALQKHWEMIDEALSSSLSSRLGFIAVGSLRNSLNAAKNGQLPLRLLPLLRALSLEFWLRRASSLGIIDMSPVQVLPTETYVKACANSNGSRRVS
ncbi:MAG TPA: asparagine synthetase B family protein [Candidatus Angelobacter sp.]|nr:asparagine synthetase B family protein [Candidatus Angelobacter sp.]